VLIIGPGGGYDILLAKLAGAADVTAVEINGAAVAAVRHFGVYDGHIYDLPGVHTIVGDGRNVVRRSHDRYDLIVLNLVYSQAAEAVSHALAENYVFTTEAFRDYIAHLTPRGYLAVTGHQALEALRAFTTGIAALQAAGVPQTTALKQVAVLMTETEDPQARPSIMLLKKSRMIQRDVTLLARSSGTLNLRPLYVPYLYLSLFRPLVEGSQTLTQYLAGSDYALTPTSDNQPFFFNFNLGLPEAVVQALILAALLSATIVALGWLGRHAAYTRQRSASRTVTSPMGGASRGQATRQRARFWPLVIYFALIGMGFMLAEVSLIQRFILLLGQPVLALVVVLTSLLLGAGLGSMASARIVNGQPARLLGVAAVIAVLLTADLALLPGVMGALVPLDLVARLVATSAILLPLGFFLGIPFPSGIALAQRDGAPRDVAVLWAVNAATSVLGSTLAVATAIAAGFTIVLWLAALCYVGAGLVTLLRPGPIRGATPAATPAELSTELVPR
jgi:hypothetical protein